MIALALWFCLKSNFYSVQYPDENLTDAFNNEPRLDLAKIKTFIRSNSSPDQFTFDFPIIAFSVVIVVPFTKSSSRDASACSSEVVYS